MPSTATFLRLKCRWVRKHCQIRADMFNPSQLLLQIIHIFSIANLMLENWSGLDVFCRSLASALGTRRGRLSTLRRMWRCNIHCCSLELSILEDANLDAFIYSRDLLSELATPHEDTWRLHEVDLPGIYIKSLRHLPWDRLIHGLGQATQGFILLGCFCKAVLDAWGRVRTQFESNVSAPNLNTALFSLQPFKIT